MTTKEHVKIVIVEDHEITRVGLKVVLESNQNFTVVGEVGDGQSAIDLAGQSHPDVILMDIGLPQVDGIEATYRIKSRHPQIKILMLTSHDSDKDILASMGSGADGFCLKDIAVGQLYEAILHILNRGIWLDPRIASRLHSTRVADAEVKLETNSIDANALDLLCYVEQGLSNEQIAQEMGISATDLRKLMRQAVDALFLGNSGHERDNQLRKQFAAKIADLAIDPDCNSNLAIGETFADKYLIESHIGRGGMGRLYKARHIHTDKVVAIKVLLPQFAKDKRVARLFQEEAKAASALDHPNAVQIYDYGLTVYGQSYIVMDYIKGNTLETLLRERVLTDKEFFNIFDQVCNALISAHSKDIIHCDIKPGNIVLLDNGENPNVVKLIDFGLAKILPPPQASIQMQLTDSFDLCGSPAYMSPEQCRGAKLDARSDLYSLGCVMYEALSGQLAAPGLTPMECFARHLEQVPASFSEVCPSLPINSDVERIIFALLQKDPQQRIQTAADLKRALSVAFFRQMPIKDA